MKKKRGKRQRLRYKETKMPKITLDKHDQREYTEDRSKGNNMKKKHKPRKKPKRLTRKTKTESPKSTYVPFVQRELTQSEKDGIGV